jgi:hypothetical protein
MTSIVLKDSILASLTPSVNVTFTTMGNGQALGHYMGWVHHPISPNCISLNLFVGPSMPLVGKEYMHLLTHVSNTF